MTTTDHLRDAIQALQGAARNAGVDPMREALDLSEASVHVGLASVAEQRTANLIAYWTALTDLHPGERLSSVVRDEADRIDHEIRARLFPEDVTS